jgi:hypothetical protein
MNRKTRWAAGSTAVGAVLVVAGVGVGVGLGTTAQALPTIAQAVPTATNPSPSNFTHPVANPYFPLTPGLVLRYRGTDGDENLHERVVVTRQTKMIQGVRTRVVHDVLRRVDNSVAEATDDWYAADNAGNVWYFGESTATFRPNGTVESREGSWKAGVNGAVAGTIMPANPKPTDAYRQEFWRGHAEDQAWIVQNNTIVRVTAGRFRHVVRSYEWSRLEKTVVSLKFYAPGLGIVLERDVAGGAERFQLVGFTKP